MEVMMTMSTRNRRFSYLATLALVALGLAAVTVPLSPAKAQMGVQIGPFGFGVEAPYPYPYYPRAYPYVYYGPGYYRGYHYGYPY
jgi:uncharacterized membrane protein